MDSRSLSRYLNFPDDSPLGMEVLLLLGFLTSRPLTTLLLLLLGTGLTSPSAAANGLRAIALETGTRPLSPSLGAEGPDGIEEEVNPIRR